MGGLAKRLFDEAFQDEVLVQVEANPNTRQWSAAGRGKVKSRPQGEDGSWWRENGPTMVQDWIDWRFTSNWTIWSTPDHQPAIELDIIAYCPDDDDPKCEPGECDTCFIPVKTVIDRIMVMGDKELCIVDLKSGARTPDSDLQLAFYRYAVYQHYGIDIKWGTYWMARKGLPVDPFPLERYSVQLMETMFKRFRKAVNDRLFLPNPSSKCRACSVNRYCAIYGGGLAHLDPDHPDFGKDPESAAGEVDEGTVTPNTQVTEDESTGDVEVSE